MRVISKIVVPTLAVLLAAGMIKLGFWQLERAQFKSEKQLIIDTRMNQPLRQLPADKIHADEWQYYQVNVRGEYLGDLGFVVDNVINKSIAGVNAVTPLRIADSDTLILVNRGWIAWGYDRTFLPNIDSPHGQVSINGLLVPVARDPFYLKDPDDSGQRKQLWSQLDLQRFIKLYGNNVQPLVLQLDENQPGSFEYIWQLQDDTWIARHKAYAFQWFGLACTLIIIMIVVGYHTLFKKEKT